VNDFAAFARLIKALRPWLGHLVVVGGWAHRLHRLHPLARPPAYQPLLTRDADLAFGSGARLAGNLGAALEKAGFREELLSDHTPPVTHYRLGDEDAGFYAEFLTPLRGGGTTRRGRPDATLSAAGITAQKLRYLDLLLLSPWVVAAGPRVGIPLGSGMELLVPNPTSFVVQKLLIHGSRRPDEKAQDVLYVHDTLELFGASLDALRTLWERKLRPAMPATTARRAVRAAGALFREVTDTTREAARIPRDRQPRPEHIRAACHYGLARVLGALD
jgi:hypothetical protein